MIKVSEIAFKNDESLATVQLELPSMGKIGYSKDVIIKEITTDEEKRFMKELLVDRQSAILNLLKMKVEMINEPDFDFESLTTFDRDFLLVELSKLTFGENVEVMVTDPQNHIHTLEISYDDLKLNKISDDFVYPITFEVDDNFTVDLKFLTISDAKWLQNNKELVKDTWAQGIYTLALVTAGATFRNEIVELNTIFDRVKLYEKMPPKYLRKILNFMNNNIIGKYGYSGKKSYYCSQCMQTYEVEIEPLNFFPSI